MDTPLHPGIPCPRLSLALLAASGLFSGSAAAQSTTVLRPDDWRVASQSEVNIRPIRRTLLDKDLVAQPTAWKHTAREWLFVRGAGTQVNHGDLPRRAVDRKARPVEAKPATIEEHLTFTPSASDTWLIGADFDVRTEAVPSAQWQSFLQSHAPSQAAAARNGAAEGRVAIRRHESTKTLVVVRDAAGRSGSSGTAMGKTGQRMEIRPLADPCITTPGSDLPMRLYVPSGIKKSLRTTATQSESGERVAMTFDRDGQGTLVLPSAGPWVIEVHGAVRAAKGAKHAWELYTTTLSFEAPPAPPREKGSAERSEPETKRRKR